jgi:hypothetical protein
MAGAAPRAIGAARPVPSVGGGSVLGLLRQHLDSCVRADLLGEPLDRRRDRAGALLLASDAERVARMSPASAAPRPLGVTGVTFFM